MMLQGWTYFAMKRKLNSIRYNYCICEPTICHSAQGPLHLHKALEPNGTVIYLILEQLYPAAKSCQSVNGKYMSFWTFGTKKVSIEQRLLQC